MEQIFIREERVESIIRHLGYEASGFQWERLSIKLMKRYMTDEHFATAINEVARVLDEMGV